MQTKVLVTGAAGYLGSIICEHLLDAGFKVVALDNLQFSQTSLLHLAANKDFSFKFGDARDERILKELLPKVDAICPLAAVVGAAACDRDPILAQTLNEDAIRLLNSLRSPNQFVVFPMTNSGYGIQSGSEFCTEETPLTPISLYGRSKVAAEGILLKSGNATSLRLATVFGTSPRMRLDLLVNYFTHKAVTEGTLVLFESHFRRNFVHIRDVADCFVYCLKNPGKVNGQAFNLGLDEANMSKKDLALKIKEHVPKLYIHFAEVGVDPDKRDYIVSNEKLRKAGFEAKRSIDDGIQELIKSYAMIPLGSMKNY
jgi:nucleoside-diphosphate-sugar epimerase